MQNQRIAIIISGGHSAGKSTTILSFYNTYNSAGYDKYTYCKAGWKQFNLHKNITEILTSWIYLVPASPTETDYSIKDRIKTFLPEMLLMAEQYGGNQYKMTKTYLNNNDYRVVEFIIDNNSTVIWKPWNNNNRNNILNSRNLAILKEFRPFIKEKIC